MDTDIFRIRNLKKEDIPYISKSVYNSWVHCEKNFRRKVDVLNKRVAWLLEKGLSKVVCLKEDEDNIVGFVICQPAGKSMLVHCVFVRAPFRQLGIATTLLERIKATHPDAVKTMNFCDEDLLMPTAHRIFTSVKDCSDEWETDRSV